MPRTATFLASDLASSLAEHVKLEANYSVSRPTALIAAFKSLVLANKVSGLALDRVDIFAHAALPDRLVDCINDGVANCRPLGAYGLKLGSFVLNLGRVGIFEYLNGAFSHMGTINLVACAIAGSIPDPDPTDPRFSAGPAVWTGRGIKFCQAIAEKAGCLVRASPAVQNYNSDPKITTTTGWALGTPLEWSTKEINYDPGDWEGPVYVFEPGKEYSRER